MRTFLWVLIVGLTGLGTAVGQVLLSPGDVVVGGWPATVVPAFGFVEEYRSDGTYKGRLLREYLSYPVGMTFDANRTLFFGDVELIRRFSASGVELQPLGFFPNSYYFTLAVDAAGNLYGGHAGIDKISPEGKVVAHFLDTVNVRDADLAADQCTMFHVGEPTSRRTVRRFDVCGGQELGDFGERLDDWPFAIRLLRGGGMLVATESGTVRLDSLGGILQRYAVTGLIALDPDLRTFWVAGSGKLWRLDLKTGSVVVGPVPLVVYADHPDHLLGAYGLAVMGEPRIALNSAASIPTLSPVALLALLAALSLVALLAKPGG